MSQPKPNELTKSVPDSNAAKSSSEFFIVGIGASAGGLEALEKLFDFMPFDTGMAFVVVQHLSPDFKSLMDQLLARHTKMLIRRVENGMLIEPNGIYLIPPKMNMAVSDRKLILSEQDQSGGLNLPIDFFFRSLAQDVREKSVAIVLSGTGSDGSRGIEDVHEAGGLVIAQDQQSAGFDGMPRNAVATGKVHVVANPESIPEKLCEYIKDPTRVPKDEAEEEIPLIPGEEIAAIFRLFRSRYEIDFSLYRGNTIHRRIDRRMQLIRCPELSEYVQRLTDDTGELEALYRDLLVEVTHFFRDKQVFEKLRNEIIPQLMASTGHQDEIRIWVPGCATGEEAYSIAMLFDDCRRQRGDQDSAQVKVFATDVHRNSLEIASSGVYSAQSMTTVPPEFRDRYFTSHSSLFHISRDLRKMVIFAPHDITKDPPFTKVDLISCRNVLIYLETEVQQRIISLFHFGLKVNGTLLLGPSESVGDLASEFEPIGQHWRFFRKLRDVRLPDATSVRLASPLFNVVRGKPALSEPPAAKRGDYVERTVLEDLLDRYVPPSFLVNKNYELVHSFGDARKMLVQPKGRPTLELLKMAEGNLRMALSAALHRVVREQERVVLNGVRIEFENGEKLVSIVAEPYAKRSRNLYLVCVEDIREAPAPVDVSTETFHANDQAEQRIIDLERELEFNKESLQTTVEELESSNEELQSTNEELVAANEELQSTNEELHSVNEELFTVNTEHQSKIDELSQLTSDMDNLMRSTEIGTIFLDRELCIRRFTPAISTAFNILEQDVGRPIDQFAYHFESPGWIDDVKQVVQTGVPREVELSARNSDTVYLKRMRPYRTQEGAVSGVVITFTDVTAVVRAEQEQRQREHLERVTRDLQDFAYAVSHDLQGPVRRIADCVRSVGEQGQTVDGDESKQLLDSAEERCRQLMRMLAHLLDYSRINTRGQGFEMVDLSFVVRRLVDDFQPVLTEVGGKVSIGQLPVVAADPIQIQKLFWHLLDNAIKYRSAQAPEIEIDAVQNDLEWTISVSDNGIGILPQHTSIVFQIFKRLEFREGVSGDGVGLALCRRIVERHNGEIWADSSNEGATIFVRLPAVET